MMEAIAANFTRPRMGRRLAVLTVSLIVIGVCVAVFKTVGFGTDPCSTFTLGVSARTGISFGTCQLAFNLLMFLPVIRLDLSRIGVGTVANMVGVGYMADFTMWLMSVSDCRRVLHGGGSGRRSLRRDSAIDRGPHQQAERPRDPHAVGHLDFVPWLPAGVHGGPYDADHRLLPGSRHRLCVQPGEGLVRVIPA